MRKQFNYTWLLALILSNIIALLVAFPTNAAKIEELIPKDSIVYVTLRDLDDVWGTIEESENWKGIFNEPSVKSKIDELNEGMQMLNLMLGIDVPGLVEAFGHQIALMLLPGDPEPMIGVVVNTGGAIREVERVVTGLTQLAGMDEGNDVQPQAGKYRKIEYSTVQIDEVLLTYAFIGDLLVIGFTPGSFEVMIDTYRKQRESIRLNKQFQQTQKEFGGGQVFAYINGEGALPLVTADMDEKARHEFDVFGLDSLQTLVFSLDLLDVDGGVQLYAQVKPEGRSGILGVLLQEGQPLQSIEGLSGEEDLFIAIAPPNSKAIWKFVETIATGADSSGGFYDGVAEVERLLNLDIENDIVGALTGEIALWGNFGDKIESIDTPIDLFYEIDAAIVAVLKNPAKWHTFLDSIQNLANLSIQQYDYNGTILHQLPFPPNNPTVTINYGEVKNLFLVSLSDERFESVVDNASTGPAVKGFKKRLKALPADPILILQLKLDQFLPTLMASGEDGIQISPHLIQQLQGMEPLLASISVKGNEAWFKVGIASEEMVEVLGKIASVIAPAIVK